MENENKKGLFQSSLEDVLHNSMMPYAEHVILERALPRVEDGLKPVQRRILYTMYNELGLTPDKPFVKSARIVGDCLGKFHPHGDSSVYDAMVRMAQPFNTREPLVDGHGNFGSVDGDPAAAMRYTEARMCPIALQMLRDIEKETVPFSLNYDDKQLEPDMLPSRYPNLLVNGTSGIAVGLATNIPPHNLAEVIDGVCAYIDKPKMTLADMMKYIPGPDFPTGGYLVGGEDLVKAYETGRGKVTMRADYKIEKSGDKYSIVYTELPYQVNKTSLVTRISDLREEKKSSLINIQDIADESDRLNGVRVVIKLKKDTQPKQVVDDLFKYTDLESTFGINMVAIADGKPQQLGLMQIIAYYVEFQRQVVLKRTKFDLKKAKNRCHILEGLVKACNNIDEVIRIIRKAEDTPTAKANLKKRFDLSDEQAQAILDLRLYRINKLEVLTLEKELEDLRKKIEELSEIVEKREKQMSIVKRELTEIKKTFRSDRLTKIVGMKEKIQTKVEEEEPEKSKFVVALTARGNLKKIPERLYGNAKKVISDSSTLSEVFLSAIRVEEGDTVLAFTDRGNCYRLPVNDLAEAKYKEKGVPFKQLVKPEPGEKPVALFGVSKTVPKGSLLFFTKLGQVKASDWSEYDVAKASFQAIKLKEGDSVVTVEEDKKDTTLFFVTARGMCLNATKAELPLQGRIASGVIGMQLDRGDMVVYAGQVTDEGEIVVVTTEGYFKRVLLADVRPLQRRSKGVTIAPLEDDEDEVLFVSYVTNPYDVVIEDMSGEIFSVNTEDVSIEKRTAKGKTLKNVRGLELKNCYRLLTVAKK